FKGVDVTGLGFLLTPEEATTLIRKNPRNREVLHPFINGDDLNSRPDQSPSRHVIDFSDMPLTRASASAGYLGPVAADYPDCLTIVETKVRPQRMLSKQKPYREL